MSFGVTGAHVCVVLFQFVHPIVGVGARGWVNCGYCWPQEWLHPAGVGLLANRSVVLATWPPLATNVVNLHY